jgi:asparagine synthase (glutamine-hydrolysing)
MNRESFYASGTYIQPDMGFFAGWVCHMDSFCDCMPVINEKKDLALIFFGENFADLNFFDELKAKHHKFDASNASYLLHMYEESGLSFLNELNGWFSGLLIDLRQGKAVLFNDRYGMQRIYYYEGKDGFYFASEAKALLKICPQLCELDMQGLGELFSCNCVLEYRSLFKNIFVLPESSAWTFDRTGGLIKEKYFKPAEWEEQPWLEKDFFYERLKETLIKVLPRYFRSSQKIGISLTGGFDTRVIMAHANMPPGKYPCYTFGGMYRDCSDVKVARKVARACEQTHQTISLDRRFLSQFADLAEKTIYISDGYLDVGGAPELYINRLARDIAPVRITGNHGSEVLRSMRWLKYSRPTTALFKGDFIGYIDAAHDTFQNVNRQSGNPLSFSLFKEAPWLQYNRLTVEQSQLIPRTPYMDNDIISLLYRAPAGARSSREIALRLIADGNPALRSIMTDRGYGGDMAFPLSVLPRLYHAFFFKAEYAYNYGMPQWLAALDYRVKPLHLEKLFLGRHKFYHFRVWYRDELAAYVREILLDRRTLSRPYINRAFVESIVYSHTKGYRNYTTEITKMLTVELIQRVFIES